MTDSDVPTEEQLMARAKEMLAEFPPGTYTTTGEKDGGTSRYLSIVYDSEIKGPSKLQQLSETTVVVDGATVTVYHWRRVPTA